MFLREFIWGRGSIRQETGDIGFWPTPLLLLISSSAGLRDLFASVTAVAAVDVEVMVDECDASIGMKATVQQSHYVEKIIANVSL